MPRGPKPFSRALPHWRAGLLLSLLLLGIGGILLRDAQLQWFQTRALRTQGRMRYLQRRPLPAGRGMIYARNGDPLAVNVPAVTLWVDPRIFNQHQSQWARVAEVVGMSPAELSARVQGGGADFAYLLRQVSPSLGKAVRALRIPGLYVQATSRTYYPLGAMTTPLLGLVHMDHQGAADLELGYN
ncbi:MAG: penicillin-binding protein 2, partial [Acidithiobacillus sp.]